MLLPFPLLITQQCYRLRSRSAASPLSHVFDNQADQHLGSSGTVKLLKKETKKEAAAPKAAPKAEKPAKKPAAAKVL